MIRSETVASCYDLLTFGYTLNPYHHFQCYFPVSFFESSKIFAYYKSGEI